jgi:hypothetical protein
MNEKKKFRESNSQYHLLNEELEMLKATNHELE